MGSNIHLKNKAIDLRKSADLPLNPNTCRIKK